MNGPKRDPGLSASTGRAAPRHTRFGQQVRDILTHLHDLSYLQVHPLVRLLPAAPHPPAPAGHRLQQQFLHTIEQLAPSPKTPVTASAWRTYLLLTLRHVEGLEVQEVCSRLGISRREYSREHSRGIDAVVSLLAPLFDQGVQAATSVAPQAGSATDGLPGGEPTPALTQAVGALPAPLNGLLAQTPLVGRTIELTFLKETFDAVAASGRGQLVFVSGEAGVGKTRLAHEVGEYARQRGGVFLEGRHTREGTSPYLVWGDALRAGLEGLSLDGRVEAIAAYGDDIRQVLPEFAGAARPAAAATELAPEERQRRLYESITGMVRRLGQRATLVVLLDDLQWAPELSVLAYVARRLEDCRVLMIGAYRDQEFHEHRILARDWAELNRARLFTGLPLRLLDAGQTAEIIGHHVGPKAAARLGSAVYGTTRGNPFFVEEVLRSLAEDGTLRQDPAGWDVVDLPVERLPQTVRIVLEERVSQLGPVTYETLAQASVLGHEFSLPVLHAMTGQDEEALVVQIERAVAARLLADRSVPGEERYAFADSQIQEVLYSGLSGPRRRRLHLRAGQAMETVYRDRTEEHLEQLAWHFSEGNDRSRGGRYAWIAGTRADRVFAWTRAAHYYQMALALSGQQEGRPEERFELYMVFGQALLRSGEPQRLVTEVVPEALALAQAFDDRSRVLRVCSLAAVGMVRYGGARVMRTVAFQRWAARAHASAAPETAGRVRADMLLAAVHQAKGDRVTAAVLQHQAVALAERLDDPDARFFAHWIMAAWSKETAPATTLSLPALS